MIGSSMDSIEPGSGRRAGESISIDLAVGLVDAVPHGRRGDEQLEGELPLQALLDDLHVQQAQEPAAEPEAERGRGLRLVEERRVVEAQLLQRVPQLGVLVGVHRVEPGEHHRLDLLEAGERLRRGPPVVGQGVADGHVRHRLDARHHEADLARGELLHRHRLGGEHPDVLHEVAAARGHEPHLHPRLQLAVHHVHEDDDSAVLVEPGVEHQAAQRRVGIARGAAGCGGRWLPGSRRCRCPAWRRPGWPRRRRCR